MGRAFFGNLCIGNGSLRYGVLLKKKFVIGCFWEGVRGLKITVNLNEKLDDTEISINCKEMTPNIENMIALLRMLNQQMVVTKDGENYLLDVSKILYIEVMERKTFIYADEAIYESKLKLYEMEERLCQSGFLRVSKSCLVHLKFIRSIKNDVERKLRLTLENGEQIMVSRQYADEIKKRMGVIG